MSSAIVVIAFNFLASFDTLNDGKFEETIIEVCKDININVSEIDIEACHRLPVIPNTANVGKKVIVKFVSRKSSESILLKKFTLSSTNFSRLNINNKPYNKSLVVILRIDQRLWQQPGRISFCYC